MLVLRQQWPWSTEAGARWLASAALFAGLLTVDWWFVSGEGRFADQIVFVTIGIVLLLASASAHVTMVLKGRRLVGLRRAALLDDRLALVELRPGIGTGPAQTTELVAVDGIARFHRNACPMTTGRPLVTADEGGHRAAGRAACGICRPTTDPGGAS